MSVVDKGAEQFSVNMRRIKNLQRERDFWVMLAEERAGALLRAKALIEAEEARLNAIVTDFYRGTRDDA